MCSLHISYVCLVFCVCFFSLTVMKYVVKHMLKIILQIAINNLLSKILATFLLLKYITCVHIIYLTPNIYYHLIISVRRH